MAIRYILHRLPLVCLFKTINILRSDITDPLIYNDKIHFQIPAEQKNLQAAVLSGANAYGDYAGRQNVR